LLQSEFATAAAVVIMWDFFSNLFNTDGFPPRWQCGIWTSGHGWLHIISDAAVFGAYTAIPACWPSL
jgi:hypothetical protein